jgi:hypothetical protein
MDNDNNRTECILEGHLQFMRDYVAKDEAWNKATVDRFLASRLDQQGKYPLQHQKRSSGILARLRAIGDCR